MQIVMYVLKDLKNPNYGLPLMYPAPQAMRRDLASKMAADPEALLASYPQDYEVWAIGEFDSEKGELSVYPDKEFVCSATDIFAVAVELAGNALRAAKAQKGGAK